MKLQEYVEGYFSNWGLLCVPMQRGQRYPVKDPSTGEPLKWSDWATERWEKGDLEQHLGLFTEDAYVVGGYRSFGFHAIDFDDWDLAQRFLTFNPIKTPMVRTKKGLHIWLRDWAGDYKYKDYREWTDTKAPVELMGRDRIIAAPPSLHASGQPYKFYGGPWKSIMEVDDVRAWLEERLVQLGITLREKPPARAYQGGAMNGTKALVSQGRRHNWLIDWAGHRIADLRPRGVSLDTMIEYALEEAGRVCEVPETDAEIRRTVTSLWRKDVEGKG